MSTPYATNDSEAREYEIARQERSREINQGVEYGDWRDDPECVEGYIEWEAERDRIQNERDAEEKEWAEQKRLQEEIDQ